MKNVWMVLLLLPALLMAAEEEELLLDEDMLLEEEVLPERVCQPEVLRVTGKMARSKEAGQFHAVRAWSHKAKSKYGKKYSWFKAERELDTGCEHSEGHWRCTVAARACE
ncbi:MAG: hypothetical protein Q9N68_03460 [Gammaproteobacteria bacterium]|nr:hypothetical protein [Gammaproteobacteria bacterium]